MWFEIMAQAPMETPINRFINTGHSLEIVRRLTTGRLIALDRDETAIEAANRRLGDYLDKVTLVHSNFSALDAVLHELGVHGVDGVLFDLGVSSPQLDEAQRGFSYKQDAPLDMRMDKSAALTAREVVNTYSYEELRRILFEYGEERYAPAIAKRICQHREQKPIETTLELADIIRSAMPASCWRSVRRSSRPAPARTAVLPACIRPSAALATGPSARPGPCA